MIDTINNQTNTQAGKPVSAPQPAPEQKTSAPADPAGIKAASTPLITPDQQADNPPAQTEIKTTMPAQNADTASKELPHQKDNLVPFEIVEPEQEPPKKLNLEDAISTLPEEKKLSDNR